MNNVGIKKYSKNIEREIPGGKSFINLCPTENNIILNINLVDEMGLNYTYNYLAKNETGSMGKGGHISFYKKLENNKITNPDFTVDEYQLDVENKETGLTLSKTSTDIYGLNTVYELKDKYDNVTKYENSIYDYPSEIKTANGEIISLSLSYSNIIIKNKDDKAILTILGNGCISKIEYKHKEKTIKTIELDYLNGYLSKINYVSPRGGVNSVSVSLTEDIIKIIDEISKDGEQYNIDSGRITSITTITNSIQKKDLVLFYDDTSLITTIADSYGTKEYYFFEGRTINNKEYYFNTLYTNDLGVVSCEEHNDDLNVAYNNSYDNVLLDGATLKNKSPEYLGLQGEAYSANELENKIVSSTARVCSNPNVEKKISLHSNGSDTVLFTCLVKSVDSTCDITASLSAYDNSTAKNSIKVSTSWKLLCVSLNVIKSFDTLTIGLKGTGRFVIGAINLFKNNFANFYTYDGNGNNKGSSNGASLSYSNNMVSGIVSENSAKYSLKYNKDKELTSFKAPYDVEVVNDYENHNIVKQTVKNGKRTITKYTEYEDDRIVSETDENGTIKYDYDNYGAIEKVTDALGCITENTYDVYGDIKNILSRDSKSSENTTIEYTYNNQRKLTQVDLKNGTKYNFYYDDKNRLCRISLNDECIFKYEYNEIDDISRQYFGESSDYFEFEYNDKKMITKASYSSSNLVYEYTYDNYDRLKKVERSRGADDKVVLEEYAYNKQGEVVKIYNDKKALTKITDNLGNVVRNKVVVPLGEFIQEHDTIDRAKGSNPESIISDFNSTYGYSVATFIENNDCVGADATYDCCSRLTNAKLGNVAKKDGIIHYVDSSNRIAFILNGKSFNQSCETFAFWFKSSSYKTNACLFHTGSKSGKSFISIYEKDYGRIEVVLSDYRGNKYTLIKTTNNYSYNVNKWNFISLDYYCRDDGLGYQFESQCVLHVNSKVYDYKTNNSSIYCDLTDSNLEVNFGYRFDYTTGQIVDTYDNCKFTLIAIGNRDYLADEKVVSFYQKTKDYIVDNALIEGNDFNAVDFSITNLIKTNKTNFGSFKVFPLENNVYSLDYNPASPSYTDIPEKFDLRQGSKVDKDRTFNFNKQLKKFAFVADGSKLSYDTNLGDSGTILAKYFIDDVNDEQCLFDAKSSNAELILSRNQDKKLVVTFNNKKHITNITVLSGTWYNIALSYDTYIHTDSYSSTTTRTIRVLCNNTEDVFEVSDTTSIGSFEIMLGRTFDSNSYGNYPIRCKTCHALYGQISNFAYSRSYSSVSTIKNIFNEMEYITKIKMYDELSLLRKEEINLGSKNVYSKKTNYKENTTQVSSETFRLKNKSFERNYVIKNGYLESVVDSEQGTTEYKYNYRGFLTEEKVNGTVTNTYTYDDNGNIITVNGTRFYYKDGTPDKLDHFGDIKIEYDEKAPGNISKIGDKEFKYEGRRLKEVSWSENTLRKKNSRLDVNITFDYNAAGLRTQKTVSYKTVMNLGGSQSTMSSSTNTYKYEYDGDDLIYEKSNNYEIFYLYDENRELYGYVLNGNKYFYLKDCLNNILGIIDENGESVVKYSYDAYGNIIEDNGTIYNPIMYKGYYYDIELNMYYCKSRFYVPELRRWLNMDNPNFLEETDINKMNLFAYCNNNPVMCYDPDGHLPRWAKWLIGGAVIAVLAVATAVTGGAAGVILGAAFHGAVTAAVSGAAIGAVSGGITAAVNHENIWDGIADGAANGFMWGAIAGAATGAATAGINIASGGVKIVGSAQKTGNLLHRFSSNVQGGKFAMQIGRYSKIGLNKSLDKLGMAGKTRPDVTAVARIGRNKLVEVVSKSQTVISQAEKISRMIASNPNTTGRVVGWALSHWFYL